MCATFLFGCNDYPFSEHVIHEKITPTFLWLQGEIDATIEFSVDRLKRGMLLRSKRRKIRIFCSWPSRIGVLQSSKIEAVLPKSEWMIQSIGCKAVSRIVAKYIFQKDISLNLKILGYMQRKKKDFELFRKFLLFIGVGNVMGEYGNGKKSETFSNA